MSRPGRCGECGGICGQHFNGCPETPENDDENQGDGLEVENFDAENFENPPDDFSNEDND